MTGYWRNKLGKIADFMFTLKAGCKARPSRMFESLVVTFVKTFLPAPPRRVKKLP